MPRHFAAQCTGCFLVLAAACGPSPELTPGQDQAGPSPHPGPPTMVVRGGFATGRPEAGAQQPGAPRSPEAENPAPPDQRMVTPITRLVSRGQLPRMHSPEYSIQGFLWWRPELAERDMLLVKDMGFTWIKQGFGWRDIELQKGKFDWTHTDHIVNKITEYGGLKLLVRIDNQPEWARHGCSFQGPPTRLQDLADFLTALATQYRGRIAAYEIWNEPNLAREWCDQAPSPNHYADMLQVAYAAVKRADPAAYVISAGLSPTGTQPPTALPDDVFLDKLYQAMGGSSDGYFDVLGVHAAGFAAPPEVSPAEAAAEKVKYGGERFFTFRRVEDLRAIQEKYGDGGKQVAVLEMGWTSDKIHPAYAWHAVSEATKADYLVRAYQYAAKHWAPWIGLVSAIYICNPDWIPADEQYWWCVNNPDGTPRPAFGALKAMPKVQ